MKQQSLFATARPTDPPPSHLAADGLNANDREKLTRLQQFALQAVRAHPGWTAKEIERIYNDFDGKIHKRIKELETKGRVRREYAKGCREGRIWAI